jgi:hypothetical protein
MIIKEMFYIPIKLKPELARASMTTSDVYRILGPLLHTAKIYTFESLPPLELSKSRDTMVVKMAAGLPRSGLFEVYI